jgi:predicted nucleic acid-binding protein
VTNLVLDASAGVELLLDTEAGRSLEEGLPGGALYWVPEHYFLEVANTLRSMELHQGLPRPRAVNAVGRITTARLFRVQLRRLLIAAWALRGHMTIGDALYVVLARELGAALVTADKRLAGAPGLGVSTITP